jgi:hypothetical protein
MMDELTEFYNLHESGTRDYFPVTLHLLPRIYATFFDYLGVLLLRQAPHHSGARLRHYGRADVQDAAVGVRG